MKCNNALNTGYFCAKMTSIFVLALLFSCVATLLALSQEKVNKEQGTNTIFLVDISKSMLSDNMFERVRGALRDYVSKLDIGDHLLILTFGEEVSIVFDGDITNDEDIIQIQNWIDNVRATGDWTYMTNAFDKAATQAKRLQKVSPKSKHLIYLFTDGKNDPPPWVRDKEGYLDFITVLNKHFHFFTSDKTFLYILSLREPEPELSEFAQEIKEAGGQVKIEREIPKIIREVEIAPSELNFGNIVLKKGVGEGNSEIIIKKMVNAKGVILKLFPSIKGISSSLEFSLDPKEIVSLKKGQKEKVSLGVSGFPTSDDFREYKGILDVSSSDPGINVNPSQIPFSFVLKKEAEGIKPWKLLLFAIAGIFLIMSLIKFRPLPPKQIWVGTEDGEIYEGSLRGRQKLWLGKNPTSEFLDLGLPGLYLAFGKKRSVMLCQEETGEKRRVDFTKEMLCELEGGKTVKLRFYEANPVAESGLNIEKDIKRPTGPMGKI